MIGITTQIEVRLNELGVKIEKKNIEIRVEKLINEFKVPPENNKWKHDDQILRCDCRYPERFRSYKAATAAPVAQEA